MFTQARTLSKFRSPMAMRLFSSADYVNVSNAATYQPVNKVYFVNSRSMVFGSEGTSETRYVPWLIKEHTFKHAFGFMGACVVGHIFPVGNLASLFAMGFCGNWAFRCTQILSNCVNKIELHEDGQTVTMYKNLGQSFDVKISDIKKMEHEKAFVETYEEGYLFPVQISGKQYYLHGFGQESIKHGEAFRAIINGQ
jgi:hypothetical protein